MSFKKTSASDFKSKTFSKTFYVEGDLTCRVLPAHGDAETPFKKYMLVWIPVNGISRCFATTANEGKDCPITNLQRIIKKVVNNPFVLEGFENPEELMAKLKHIAFRLNLQSFFLYNVIVRDPKSKDQTLGTLFLKTTGHKALSNLVNEYLDQSFDPLDIDNGIWFKFSKVKDNDRVTYACSKFTVMGKDERGRMVESLLEDPIKIPLGELESNISNLGAMYKVTEDDIIRTHVNDFLKSQIDINILAELKNLTKDLK